jgi:hypothetical protein
MVLTEEEAIELIAFLITSAQSLSSEPSDYGPMRLLSAATKLSRQTADRMTGNWQALFMELSEQIPLWLRERERDPEGYHRSIDQCCQQIARELR